MKVRHIHYTDDLEQSLLKDLYDAACSLEYAENSCKVIGPLIENKMLEDEEFIRLLDVVRDRLHVADIQIQTIQSNVLNLVRKKEADENNQTTPTRNGEADKDIRKQA